MAGAVDLLLYGVAVFISPLAVYFKKGVGAQFWVNCCLYCLMGVPGAIHAFYIIHTNKHGKKSRQGSTQAPSIVVTQQRYPNLPSLPHPDRYHPPVSYSPYEDHPPPLPPKTEEEERLTYDPSLHPNASGASIEPPRPEPQSTPQPEPQLTPRPEPQLTPRPEQEPQLEQEPQTEIEPQLQASSSAPTALSHSDAHTLAYPEGYHPNADGQNIANAKAVLHTYQIPERTFPLPEPEPAPENTTDSAKRPKTTMGTGTTGTAKGSMWSLRSKGKGISSLNVNSPTEVTTPTGASSPRGKWGAVSAGPSWLKRRKNRQGIPTAMTTTTTEDEDGPSTMTMTWWDGKYDSRPGAKKHARTGSESVALPFPMPPGSVRPVVDRTGTSNTILRRPLRGADADADAGVGSDGEARLDPVDEDLTPRNERTLSEGEGAAEPKKARRGSGRFDTDTEASPIKATGGGLSRAGGLRSRFSRRRPRLDTVGIVNDAQAPDGVTSAPPGNVNPVPPVSEDAAPPTGPTSAPVLDTSPVAPQSSSPSSPTWHRHIASPALLASSIEEPRQSFFRRRRTSSTSPTKIQPASISQPQLTSTFAPQQLRSSPPQHPQSSPPRQLRSTAPTRDDIDFAMGEFGLGGAGDAYSAGSRALQSRTRRTSSGTGRRRSECLDPGLTMGPRQRTGSDGRRVSVGTTGSPTPTSEMFGVPVMRRGLTQGTFGTGVTKMSSSTGATSEESAGAQRPTLSPQKTPPKSEGHVSQIRTEYEVEDELSQEDEVELWIKKEDERRQVSAMALDGHSHAQDAPSESQSHAHSSLGHVEGPDEASAFPEESSGFAGIGVGSAVEKGRAGKLEIWDQPGWDGSNPNSAGPVETSKQSYEEADPFHDPPPMSASEDTHASSYATGRESFSPVKRSPPALPARSPPAVPKPAAPLRMGTFGTAGANGSTTSFGLLSPPREPQRNKGKGPVLTGSPPSHPVSLMPAKPPPVPSRPSSNMYRPQSPKIPPKPAVLRSMSTEDDDMSAVYARALRDEV